ncbi:MAG: hypothetical protein WAV00_10475 [Nocardioides sp.]
MNSFSNNPDGVRLVAQYTIDQRVRDAEARRLARSTRPQRPTWERVAKPKTSSHHIPWWVFRYLNPAH